MWRALEKEPRQNLKGHEEGKLGHKPKTGLRATAPVLDPTRSFLAYVPWPYEGQFVELRSVPLRIGHTANPLGARRHGPIYPSIIGFGVHCGAVHGMALCRMFRPAISGQ